MSGNGSMNHGAAAQASPAAPPAATDATPPADAVDHAAMGHVPPAQAAVEPKAQAPGHSCSMMAAKDGAPSAGGCACCANMAASADGKAAGCAMCASKMAAKASPADAAATPDPSQSAMPGRGGCAKHATVSTVADPLAEDSSVTEQ